MTETLDTHSRTPTPRHDGWTPERQRDFLEHLAISGLVRDAAKAAGMSHEAAYKLRNRASGAAFKLGWDAALHLSRISLADALMERAIAGQEEILSRDPDGGRRTRYRFDNRLALALLARLDRFAENNHATQALPRLIAGDWEAYLDMICDGHGGSGAAMFVAARQDDIEPCQLCDGRDMPDFDIDAQEQTPPDHAEVWHDPTAAYGESYTADFVRHEFLGLWWDRDAQEFRTNFPPPPGFDGFEEGIFLDDQEYQRALTPQENDVAHNSRTRAHTEMVAQAEAERCTWFADMASPATARQADRASNG
jgi:hypothetical protein